MLEITILGILYVDLPAGKQEMFLSLFTIFRIRHYLAAMFFAQLGMVGTIPEWLERLEFFLNEPELVEAPKISRIILGMLYLLYILITLTNLVYIVDVFNIVKFN